MTMCDPKSDVHDDMLFSMLKDCKALPVFLDHIFGFLQRRTDFYHIAKDPQSPVGLPEGLAESLVKHAYFKWKPQIANEITILEENEVPSAIIEEVVTTSEDIKTVSNDDLDLISTVESIDISSDSNKIQQLPESKDEHAFGFSNSERYNGTAYENYCWSQTITEVDVIIKVPEIVKAKDLKVYIQTNKIMVKLKEQVLLEGTLCQKCKNNDAIWSIDKQKLQIHLDKCKEMWWDCLVTSENRLDLSKIDCSRPYEELSDDAKAKIEELNWNQERKRLGLPTSDELANQELLKKAWNAEGSPFSGPFDPTQVKFN